jgi:hypothetical protein
MSNELSIELTPQEYNFTRTTIPTGDIVSEPQPILKPGPGWELRFGIAHDDVLHLFWRKAIGPSDPPE